MRRMSSLSAYGQTRLDNIAANRATLIALGIEDDVADLRSNSVRTQRAVKGAAVNKRSTCAQLKPWTSGLRLPLSI